MMYIRKGRNQSGHARSHHPDEPPTGYSLTSRSPAELVSASPAGLYFAPKSLRCQQILCLEAVDDYNPRAGDGPVFRRRPSP